MTNLTFNFANPDTAPITVTVDADTAREVMAGFPGPVDVTAADGTVVRAGSGEVAWVEESRP